jgi:hypothetical protein
MKKAIIFLGSVLVVTITIFSCTTPPILPDLSSLTSEDPCPTGIINFKREIQPIISTNCAFSGCHDAITAEEGVILDTYENIIKEVVPFDPNNSELYEYLIVSDPDDVMPPPPYDLLTTAQINLIQDWINQGALDVECGGCDTTDVSYLNDVYPIMQTNCLICHNLDRQDGGVNLDGYDLIKSKGTNGKLMGTIEHKTGYSAMPPSGTKIDQCFIDQLNSWIADGMPNN